LLCTLVACEEKILWDIDLSEPQIVIDAIITSDNTEQEIYVYYTSPELNSEVIPVSGASIIFTDGNNFTTFTEQTTSPGSYTATLFPLATGSWYALIFEHEGFADTAFAEMAPVSDFRPYAFEPSDDTLLKYIHTGSDLPAMTEV
jgi:hypothetical protein